MKTLLFTLAITLFSCFTFGQLNETFQSWSSRTSYLTTQSTQSGNGGTWLYTKTIVAPGGAANGTGSAGYTQLSKAGGELITPVISSGGVGTLTLKLRVSGSNGGFALYKRANGGAWELINSYTTSATTAITSNITINDGRSNLELRIYNNNANRALYLHDFTTTVGPPPPSNDDPAGAITLTINDGLGYKTYSNENSTNTTTESTPSCASYTGQDVWFKVVVPQYVTVLDFDTQTGDITDGGMTIYRGTPGSLTEIECDDDDALDGLMPWIYREDFIPGETIYIRFWEYGGGTVGTFKIFVSTPAALPVDLTQFEAVGYPEWNVVKWTTASEHNSSYFSLESSTDGESWREIAKRFAAGNSTETIKYSWIDYTQKELTYYRLVQFDIDGKFKIYGPIIVQKSSINKVIVKYVNLMGQEINPLTTTGLVIEVYSDGSTKKVIR